MALRHSLSFLFFLVRTSIATRWRSWTTVIPPPSVISTWILFVPWMAVIAGTTVFWVPPASSIGMSSSSTASIISARTSSAALLPRNCRISSRRSQVHIPPILRFLPFPWSFRLMLHPIPGTLLSCWYVSHLSQIYLVYGAPHDEKIRGRKEGLLVDVKDQNKLHPGHDLSIFLCLCCSTCGGSLVLYSRARRSKLKLCQDVNALTVKILEFEHITGLENSEPELWIFRFKTITVHT